MKIGLIGERHNFIAFSMLKALMDCQGLQLSFFIEADIDIVKREKIYGESFDYGWLKKFKKLGMPLKHKTQVDCKNLADAVNIQYIAPQNHSINQGLPSQMYEYPEADYVLIAGCDQLIDKNGLRLAKKKIINYHYSPLPAYRGKNSLFWQWYNREPFIGYTFHEVDLGVDTGTIIYQNIVPYNPDDDIRVVAKQVIETSSKSVCELFNCLMSETKKLLADEIKESYYPAKKYLELTTVTPHRSREEIIGLINRLGHVRLKNGLVIRTIVAESSINAIEYKVEKDGIVLPLADGHLKVKPFSRLPFALLRFLIGNKLIQRLE